MSLIGERHIGAHLTVRQTLALMVIYLVWGTTYAGMRVLGEWFPVFLAQGTRFGLGGLGLLLLQRLTGGARSIRTTSRELLNAGFVGFLLLVSSGAVLIYVEQTATSSLAAMLSSTVPIWALCITSAARRRFPPILSAIAVFIGLGGIALLAWPSSSSSNSHALQDGILLIGASLSAAFGAFFGARFALPEPARLAAAYEMVIAGCLVVVIGLCTGEVHRLRFSRVPASGWFAFAYLVVAGSMLALPVFAWLVTQIPVTTVATYSYVNPIVAVVVGVTLLGEHLALRVLAGAAVVLIATMVIIFTQREAVALQGGSSEPGPAPVEARTWR